MPGTTSFTIGAEATCADGPCGTVAQVVIDPIARRVTHLIVEPEHREGLGRLVPVEWAQISDDAVALRCSTAEFEALEVAEQVRFLSGVEGDPDYTPEQMYLWPWFGGNSTPPVTVDSLPPGEVAVHRGAEVHASDGRVGEVEGLVLDKLNHRVTHLLLKQGHLFGSRDVAIPISAVSVVDDTGVLLSVTKEEVSELPDVEVGRAS